MFWALVHVYTLGAGVRIQQQSRTEARSQPTTEAEWSPSHVPFVEGDGFPSGSAPSAQWGEGRADKVIYLHLSTSCNGWHFHLSLKLHHLAAAPLPLLLPRKIKGGWEREREKLDQTSWTIGRRKENRTTLSDCRWGLWECGSVEWPNHSLTSNRTRILGQGSSSEPPLRLLGHLRNKDSVTTLTVCLTGCMTLLSQKLKLLLLYVK